MSKGHERFHPTETLFVVQRYNTSRVATRVSTGPRITKTELFEYALPPCDARDGLHLVSSVLEQEVSSLLIIKGALEKILQKLHQHCRHQINGWGGTE